MFLCYIDLKQFYFLGTLQGLFVQINGEDDAVREKSIKFLASKVKKIIEDSTEKDIEDFIITECKKVKK